MPKPEGGGGEGRSCAGVDAGVVAVVIAGAEQGQLVIKQAFLAQHQRKELVVGDVLDGGCYNVPGLLDR